MSTDTLFVEDVPVGPGPIEVAWNSGYDLGHDWEYAAPPADMPDDEAEAWRQGWACGRKTAEWEELETIYAMEDAMGGPASARDWPEDEDRAAKSNGGHPSEE